MKHPARQHEYEFFGPYGPAVLTAVLPCVVLGLVYACNSEGCFELSYPALTGFPSDQPLYSHEAMAAVIGWMSTMLLLHVLLPGEQVEGVLLPSGRKLPYKLNGEQHTSSCARQVAHHTAG